MFDNLFQIVKYRKRMSFVTPHITVRGTKPFSVMYIKIPYVENLSMWVGGKQRLMTEGEIVEECREICRVRGAVTEAKKDGRGTEVDFEPEGIKARRFKVSESCKRSIDVTVGTHSTLVAETRVKVIVGDTERVMGGIHGQLGFRE